MYKLFKTALKIMLLLLFFSVHYSYCDWVSEWLTPIQLEYKDDQVLKSDAKVFIDANKLSTGESFQESPKNQWTKRDFLLQNLPKDYSINALKYKLESTLQSAKDLAETIKRQIRDIETKEQYLKEAIAYGKNGVTTLTISTINNAPRTYIIRDGLWSICSGMVQNPTPVKSTTNIFNEIFSIPRCIGQEIPSIKDPCVFNSITKYETIPTVRRSTYKEDDYLCLKTNFNNTLEQYMSVPRHIVNDTCKKGTLMSLSDNILKCGCRILSEYKYYPNKNALAAEVQEYCSDIDGFCKLMVAWHVSNSSIENFETLSDDEIFKKTFLNYL